MSNEHSHLKRIDTAYCILVSSTAVIAVLGGWLFRSTNDFVGTPFRLIAPIAAYSLVVLFVLGILLQLTTRRCFKPKEVACCIVLTGVWSGFMVAAFLFH